MQELDASHGEGINNSGQITVQNQRVTPTSAYLNDNGITTNIGTSGSNSAGWAINDSGHVTGASTRAFVYKDDAMTDIGALVGGSPLEVLAKI
jgi:probable HAF family extracellular repeat protein